MNLKNKILTGLAALVLSTGTAKAEEYIYQDDFTNTNKILTESYSHSDIITQLPLVNLNPVIVHYNILDNGVLEFKGGFANQNAELVYRLPLNATIIGSSFASIQMDVGTNSANFAIGNLKVSSSVDGIDWYTDTDVEGLSTPFPHRINLLSMNMTGEQRYLKIEAKNLIIDNLQIHLLAPAIPNEMKSFGDIKAEYR